MSIVDEPDSGPRLPDGLGEPQWAMVLSQARAHFLTMHPKGPAWVMTACGITLANQMIYHPGDMPLCADCRRRHRPPRRALSPAIIAFLTLPVAPVSADRAVR